MLEKDQRNPSVKDNSFLEWKFNNNCHGAYYEYTKTLTVSHISDILVKHTEEVGDLKQTILALEAINEELTSSLAKLLHTMNSSGWIQIMDENRALRILSLCSDSTNKILLDDLIVNPMSIPEIIRKYGLSRASGYRKISELIDSNLLVSRGYFLQNDGKRVYKYISAIKNMRVYFDKDKVLLFVLPNVKISEFASL